MMDRKNELIRSPKKLSVLIPSLRTRMDPLRSMLDKIQAQIDARTDVEVVSLVDCKTMSLGRKRNLLLDMAQGEYLTFVNDDDDIHPKWLDIILGELRGSPGVDVLSVRAECKRRLSPFQPWQHSHIMATSLRCPESAIIYDGQPQLFLHKPVMWCVWRTEIARQARFKDATYGEDNPWALAASEVAKTEAIVPIPIYCYFADDSTSEAGLWRDESECGMDMQTVSKSQDLADQYGGLLEHLRLIAETPKESETEMVTR